MTKLEYVFTGIPKQLLEDCKQGREDAYFLYSLLLSRTNPERDNGERICWPTVDQIQLDTGWGRNRIMDCINFLCIKGWIGNIEKGNRTNGEWSNNKYTINTIQNVNQKLIEQREMNKEFNKSKSKNRKKTSPSLNTDDNRVSIRDSKDTKVNYIKESNVFKNSNEKLDGSQNEPSLRDSYDFSIFKNKNRIIVARLIADYFDIYHQLPTSGQIGKIKQWSKEVAQVHKQIDTIIKLSKEKMIQTIELNYLSNRDELIQYLNTNLGYQFVFKFIMEKSSEYSKQLNWVITSPAKTKTMIDKSKLDVDSMLLQDIIVENNRINTIRYENDEDAEWL